MTKAKNTAAAADLRLLSTKTADSEGILLSRLDEKAMDRAAEALKIDGWEHLLTPQDRAEALHTKFQVMAQKDGVSLLVCNECSGESPGDADECAFCGDGSEEDDAEGEEDGEDEELQPGEQSAAEAMAPKAGDPKPERRKKEPVAPPKAAPKSAIVPVTKQAPGGVLAPVAAGLKEKDLDRMINDVHALKGAAGAAYWDLGAAVAKIRDTQAWRLRVQGDGKTSVFKTWEAFCNSELGIQPQSALTAMDLSKRFPRADAEKYGRSKMTFLVRADDAHAPDIRRAIESGATKRDLVNLSKDLKAKNPKPIVEKTTGKERRAPEVTRPAKGDKIAIATLLDKTHAVKAWKRPAGKLSQLEDPKDLARARTLKDEPVGRFEFENGNVMYIALEPNPAGELVFKLKFAREEAPKAAKK